MSKPKENEKEKAETKRGISQHRIEIVIIAVGCSMIIARFHIICVMIVAIILIAFGGIYLSHGEDKISEDKHDEKDICEDQDFGDGLYR